MRGLIGIIVALIVVGLMTGSFYFYLQKQTKEMSEPEMPKITEKPAVKEVKPSPLVYFSADSLEQGDTLLIRIEGEPAINEVSGELGSAKVNFFKPADLRGQIGIAGIDVREKPGKRNLAINFPDGHKINKELDVIERKFPITRFLVTKELEERGLTQSKIIENVIGKEGLIVEEIFSIYTPKAYFSEAFANPLKEMKVVGNFGDIRKNGELTLRHLGVDLDADELTPVYAINDGLARFSEELTTYGKILMIDHGLGVFSLYLHLNKFNVLAGETVKRGDVIALSGNTGYSIEPHLHFSIRVNKASVDPLRFIETISQLCKNCGKTR